jgi:hypothetical protein
VKEAERQKKGYVLSAWMAYEMSITRMFPACADISLNEAKFSLVGSPAIALGINVF